MFMHRNIKISEDFIEKILKDTKFIQADWINLIYFYKMSENFIKNHIDKIF